MERSAAWTLTVRPILSAQMVLGTMPNAEAAFSQLRRLFYFEAAFIPLFHLLLYLQAVRKDDPDQVLRHGDHARERLADEVIVIGKRVVLQRVEGGIYFNDYYE